MDFSPAREILTRNNRTGTVETVAGRVGIQSASGTIPVEFKAGSTAGDAAETDLLWRSLLGGRRQITSQVTSKASGHTTTVIQIEDADIGDFTKNDIILVREAGDFHVSPITAVDPTGGAANITLLVAAGSAFSGSVVIEKSTIYYPDSANAPTLSITNYLGGEIREKITGARAASAEFNNFTVGQLSDIAFGVEALELDREVGTPVVTPSFDTSVPPVILEACIYQDGNIIDLNSFGLSITNTIGFITSTCEPNGRKSSRITALETGGTLNPYMEDDDVDRFDLFNQNTAFSLFGFAKNNTSTAGEFNEVVAFYMPNCRISELATAVEDDILQDSLTYTAHKTDGNDQVFIATI